MINSIIRKSKHKTGNSKNSLQNSPLGKKSSYIDVYTPSLLFVIPRQLKRDEIGVPPTLPFKGCDIWNAYEISWLNSKGKPIVAIAQFNISCASTNIVESKSFKLYLNSFNNTKFNSVEAVKSTLEQDIKKAVSGQVIVKLFRLEDIYGLKIHNFQGDCLDDLDIDCKEYTVNPMYLSSDFNEEVSESLYSNLLKSNCLVTGQPDWGSVEITYSGPKINKMGLLKYIVSFRSHNEFHEQCAERMFMDIMQYCKPKELTVEARYTRRGGLDINPIRSTREIESVPHIRLARQ